MAHYLGSYYKLVPYLSGFRSEFWWLPNRILLHKLPKPLIQNVSHFYTNVGHFVIDRQTDNRPPFCSLLHYKYTHITHCTTIRWWMDWRPLPSPLQTSAILCVGMISGELLRSDIPVRRGWVRTRGPGWRKPACGERKERRIETFKNPHGRHGRWQVKMQDVIHFLNLSFI